MTEEKTLKDSMQENTEMLKKLNEHFENMVKSPEVKTIKPKKLGSKGKKGYVNYIYIRENGVMDMVKVPIEEGTTSYDGSPRLATPEHVLNWKNVPTIIQPSWSCKPFSPAVNMEETAKEKMLSVGYRLLTNRQELGEIKPKKKVSGLVIFFIVIAIIVIGYLLLR